MPGKDVVVGFAPMDSSCPLRGHPFSSQDRPDDVACNVGQAVVTPLMFECQTLVIDT